MRSAFFSGLVLLVACGGHSRMDRAIPVDAAGGTGGLGGTLGSGGAGGSGGNAGSSGAGGTIPGPSDGAAGSSADTSTPDAVVEDVAPPDCSPFDAGDCRACVCASCPFVLKDCLDVASCSAVIACFAATGCVGDSCVQICAEPIQIAQIDNGLMLALAVRFCSQQAGCSCGE